MNYIEQKILTTSMLKIMRWKSGQALKQRIYYNIKTWKIIQLRKWIYVFAEKINELTTQDYFMIANSIYSPSYISFETVLQKEWIIFQDYNTIFVASRYSKTIEIKKIRLKINFIRLPDSLLLNNYGLKSENGYTIASPERALCDILYKNHSYPIDNLNNLDIDMLKWLADIYYFIKKKVNNRILNLLKNQDE